MTATWSKVVTGAAEAVECVKDGDTIMFGGFGGAGFPFELRDALARRRLEGLTLVGNNADFGALALNHSIKTIICSFPTGPSSGPVLEQIESGAIELQVTPQGTLAEQIRAGGAGLGGVLTPTALDTELAARWREMEYDGVRYLLVPPLRANVSFIKATTADQLGNLVHRAASRNFNPLMAMAADVTVAEVGNVVPTGHIDPEHVHVPSVFVDTVVVAAGRGPHEGV